jgi:hypothetical protein
MKSMLIVAIVSLGLATGALTETANARLPATPDNAALPVIEAQSGVAAPCGPDWTGTRQASAASPSAPGAVQSDVVPIAETQCAGNAPPTAK